MSCESVLIPNQRQKDGVIHLAVHSVALFKHLLQCFFFYVFSVVNTISLCLQLYCSVVY